MLNMSELTRLSANQPCVWFAEMVSSGNNVIVQVSGGKSLALYPCLNIMGGLHPRDVSESIDMSGIADVDRFMSIPFDILIGEEVSSCIPIQVQR